MSALAIENGSVAQRTEQRASNPRAEVRLLSEPLVSCRNCGEAHPESDFEFITRYGTKGRYAFSWCRECREAVTEASCARCKEIKPREDFYANPGRSCGLSSYCIACQNASSKESVEKFREAARELSQELRAADDGLCLAFVNLGGFKARVRCSRKATVGTSGYCLTHASPEARRAASSIRRRLHDGPSPQEWEQILAQREQDKREAAETNPELAALIADQERDDRFSHRFQPRWLDGRMVYSLDEPIVGSTEDQNMRSQGPSRHEVNLAKGSLELDPAAIVERIEDAERLFALAGTREPDDILRMDGLSLEWLRERLRLEGLAPRGVQAAERDRLRDPDRHAGQHVEPGRRKHGRKTRQQKIAHKEANRNRGNSNRPEQQPKRRWTRDWMDYEDAA